MVVFAEYLKRLAAHLDELLEASGGLLGLIDHIEHVRGEEEGRAVALEAGKGLRVAQVLAVVDVEHVTGVLDHDVVVVAVADAEYVSGLKRTGTTK